MIREFEVGSMDHGLGVGGICADLICGNPSDPSNQWSIHRSKTLLSFGIDRYAVAE